MHVNLLNEITWRDFFRDGRYRFAVIVEYRTIDYIYSLIIIKSSSIDIVMSESFTSYQFIVALLCRLFSPTVLCHGLGGFTIT